MIGLPYEPRTAMGTLSQAATARYGRAMTARPPRIAVLLASFNGARFIRAQLDSLTAQTHRDWRLIVSDDGSDDGTRDLVRGFAANHPGRDVTLLDGPRRRATANFLSLIGAIAPGEALAFCDQDDVWLPDRLALGVAALDRQSGPALHVTRTIICDGALRPLRPAPLYRRPPGFRNALVQACTPANTMLVSPAGVEILQAAAGAALSADIVSHDWWSYQMISGAGGTVIRDPAQTVLYRQHDGNVMGRNDTLRAMLARLRGLGDGAYGGWLRANVRALDRARDLLTGPNAALLDRFAGALDLPGPLAARELLRIGVYRQTRAATAALFAAAVGGRLRARGRAGPE